jgi:dCMP deaminase
MNGRSRPSWEEYALILAEAAVVRSEDPYVQVGACALRYDGSVAGVGYNGPPPGVDIDWKDRDVRRAKMVHAEPNSLVYSKPGEVWLVASTIAPCPACLTYMCRYGIKRVIYRTEYENTQQDTFDIAREYGMDLIKICQTSK